MYRLLLVEGEPILDITVTQARVAVRKNGAAVAMATPVESTTARMPAGGSARLALDQVELR